MDIPGKIDCLYEVGARLLLLDEMLLYLSTQLASCFLLLVVMVVRKRHASDVEVQLTQLRLERIKLFPGKSDARKLFENHPSIRFEEVRANGDGDEVPSFWLEDRHRDGDTIGDD